jgi:hypothetical protein
MYRSSIFLLLLASCSAPTSNSQKDFQLFSEELAKEPAPEVVRFEKSQIASGQLDKLVLALNERMGTAFSATDFKVTDNVKLSHFQYVRYVQLRAGVPVKGTDIRVWLEQDSGNPVLVEARIQRAAPAINPSNAEVLNADFKDALVAVKKDLSSEFSTGKILNVQSSHAWIGNRLVRRLQVKSKRGTYIYDFPNGNAKVHRKSIRPGESADAHHPDIPVQGYKLWEYAGDVPVSPDNLSNTEPLAIRNLQKSYSKASLTSLLDSYSRSFLYSNRDADGELDAEDLYQGKWTGSYLEKLFPEFSAAKGEIVANEFGGANPVRLIGKNVGVFIDPSARRTYTSAISNWSFSPQFISVWTPKGEDYLVTHRPAYFGATSYRPADISSRLPTLADGSVSTSNTEALLRQGFDELQVYTGVDTFMESLRELGFNDPEMSTQPFAAVLFDTDIDMRNNAYCSGNTIHFTTYDANQQNYARDNTTIWHELGHGIQGRLMGPHLDSSDGYGLWEGMADFLAQLIVSKEYGLADFKGKSTMRIVNKTWFNNTNESHDEGEAYGGTMYDMLTKMMEKYGEKEGLLRMTDLTLQTMRLTRDHLALTPAVWFQQMQFVGSLSYAAQGFERKAGDLSEIIESSLAHRNYAPGKEPSKLVVTYQGKPVEEGDLGSRYAPVELNVKDVASHNLELEASILNGDVKNFKFPLTVRVTFNNWALQGSVKWAGEEKGPLDFIVATEKDVLKIPLSVLPECDNKNTTTGLCSDYVHINAYNAGDNLQERPVAKKRFYVKLKE